MLDHLVDGPDRNWWVVVTPPQELMPCWNITPPQPLLIKGRGFAL